MEVKKLVASGLVSAVIIFVVSFAVDFVVQRIPGFSYNVLSLGGMRPINDPVMILFFLHPVVLGFALAIVFAKLGRAFKGSAVERGKNFGLLMWLVAGLPSAWIVFSSMNYPVGFTINSVVAGAVYFVLAGITLAKLNP